MEINELRSKIRYIKVNNIVRNNNKSLVEKFEMLNIEDIDLIFNNRDILDFLLKSNGQDMWSGRYNMFKGIIVDLFFNVTEKYNIKRTPSILYSFFIFENLMECFNEEEFGCELGDYLENLPAFNKNSEKQSAITMEQHGYLVMQNSVFFSEIKKKTNLSILEGVISLRALKIKDKIINF